MNLCDAKIARTWDGSWAKKNARRKVSASLLRDSIFLSRLDGFLSPSQHILKSSLSFCVCDLPNAEMRAVLRAAYWFCGGG